MSRAKHSVLLVDDDPRNVIALAALLEPMDHRVIHANDGSTALELFECEAPDIVLCDLVMHGMNGLEVLQRIRAHRELGHTPVILITAFGERELRLRALELGVDEFLEKPIDIAILRARITTLLRLKASRDDLARRHETLQRLQREQREVLGVLVTDVTGTIEGLQSSVDWLDTYAEAGPGVVHQAVARMQSGLDRLTKIVHDLSWVSWLDGSVFPVSISHLAVDSLVNDVVRKLDAMALGLGIDVQSSVASKVLVHADARLLRRVIENLLDNALRHAPRGGRVRLVVDGREPVEVRVCNEGPPIPREHRQRVFEKFARGTREPGHPGLGLYFCRRALEVQGASIHIAEEPGWPVTFVVRFPVAASAQGSSGTGDAERARGPESPSAC